MTLIYKYTLLCSLLSFVPVSVTAQNEADSIYIASQKSLQHGDKHKAIKLLRSLLDFEEFKEDAQDMIKAAMMSGNSR